jgi:S-layer protein (TIGR01567 family)
MILKRWMEIRKIWLMVALAIIAMHLVLLSTATAQDPVESAEVRGHTSNGNGTWSASDFGWFYYDLDKAEGGEQLKIGLQGRSAEKGQIVYSSKPWSREFEYKPWGTYNVLAFLGKLYLAGYPESSFADEVSSLGKGDLREVLRDEKDTYTLTDNSTLPLAQGYALAALETASKDGAVNFILLKNGKPVYGAVVSLGGTFTYKVDGVPVLLVHLASSMKGEDKGFTEVDGIFQVSDLADIKLFEGGRLGNMELIDLSEDGIEFRNSITLTFTRNFMVPLTADLAIIVLDQPDLVYYPVGTILDYGLHEIRGPVFGASPAIMASQGDSNLAVAARWNSQNYSGFYFDPAKILGEESLILYNVQGRRVPSPIQIAISSGSKRLGSDGFQYISFLQPKEFDFKSWGKYFVINFLGTQWFAGYDSSMLDSKATKSLLEHDYLGKVLLDTETQGIVFAGNYTFQEGYEMRIRDVGNDSIFLQLLKNGVSVDNSVVKSNSTYIYKKDLGDVKDLPIIMVHLNNVFNNGMKSFATIDGVFQISDQYLLSIDQGLLIGDLEIISIQPNGISMVNDDYVDLNRDSTVSIGPGMNIRVADNDTLRYYLYTSAYVVPAPKPPLINKSGNVTSGAPENFSMIVQAAEIRRVTADILDSSNKTVFTEDITPLGLGSGDLWIFSWKWNATTLQLSDDKSQVLDARGNSVPGLLYLNQTTPPVQVGIVFDSSGRISRIASSKSVYYVTRSEYSRLNTGMDYDAMFANETARERFLKIEPGKSILQFYDVIDNKFVLSKINHTLHGTLEVLEPHAFVRDAKTGRYELRVRIENAVNAIQVFGEFLNVTPGEVRGISLGSTDALAGESVAIPLEAPISGAEKRINISYDATMVKATGISGECEPTWKVDSNAGRISVLLPGGCGSANLTFDAKNTASKRANETTYLNVTGTSGFKPEYITNGSITIVAGDKAAEKSDALGFVASIAAILAGAYARRRG